MKDFEKNLRGATAPDIRVDEFKQTLRRSLLSSMQAAPSPRWRLAFGFSGVAAVAFAALLVVFVLYPALPERLHGLMLEADPATLAANPAGDSELEVNEILSQINASPQVDQAFLESWYRQQSRQVEVTAVGNEKLLAFRQFELADGQRVVVLTEIGDQQSSSTRGTGTRRRTF